MTAVLVTGGAGFIGSHLGSTYPKKIKMQKTKETTWKESNSSPEGKYLAS